MNRLFDVAVVGATGAVGETMVSILEERDFPVGQFYPLSSERSAGQRIQFKGKSTVVHDLAQFDFSKVQVALFSAGGSVSEQYAPKAAEAGCVVIDNSSAFRYQDDIPLVVSEVNPHALDAYSNHHIIANPNCSTMQMLVALAPIHRELGLQRLNISTYQSVSGAGKKGINELAKQTMGLLSMQPVEHEVFADQIAFNCVPHIDRFENNGFTREEMKMIWETHKILENNEIGVNPTAVRVPVFYGHAESVHLETAVTSDVETIKKLLQAAPGVTVMDDCVDGGYPTPATHATGQDAVFVGRIRKDPSHERGFNLWIVADNIRKGAALNAVQIAELLVNHHL